MTDIIEPGGGDPAPEPAAAPDRLPPAGQSIVAQRAITAPATVDRAARTVEVVWSTGARARNFVPTLGLITEELEMSPNAVRMEALRSGRAPVLDTHRRGGARDVLGRVFIHAGAPALPVATLTSNDLRGDVTIQGARPRRDLFNGVRAVYVEPAANWQPTDAPPLLASNYVAQDGGEMIYRDLEFPLTTSVSTVQRLMKVELERNRRQRTVAFPANLSALRLRPWEAAMVALDRLTPFPARVTAWSLATEGGVDLTLEEEDAAVWDWNPAVDERATGANPAVVLPNPGVIAAPASITIETPQATAFAVLAVSWAAVGSSHLTGYQVEFLPASVAAWQGYGGSLGATAAAIPNAEPTGFRVRAVARSGAVSGWRQALVPAAVAAPTATGIAGGIRLSGGFPADATRLQVFEASTNSLASAVKLPAEPTSLFWDRIGLSAGDTSWYLEVAESVLRRWMRDLSSDPAQAFPGHGQMKPEQQEIDRLRREVAKLKAERDILKKAAAYFAKDAI